MRGGQAYSAVRENRLDRERLQRLDEERRQQQIIDNALRQRDQKLQEAGIAVAGLEPNSEVTPDIEALLEGTPYAGRLRKQNFLAGGDEGPTQAPITTLKPTFEQSAQIDERRQRNELRARRDALAAQYGASNDPVLKAFGNALAAGVDNPPMPFDVQKQHARELGGIENQFALQRINAQVQGMLQRYTHPNGQTPEQRNHFLITSQILRNMGGDVDWENPQEVEKAMQIASQQATAYLNMQKGTQQTATPFDSNTVRPMSSHTQGQRPAASPQRKDPLKLF